MDINKAEIDELFLTSICTQLHQMSFVCGVEWVIHVWEHIQTVMSGSRASAETITDNPSVKKLQNHSKLGQMTSWQYKTHVLLYLL